MPNQRKPGKKKIGVWVTDEEKVLIDRELKKHGLSNVAELLKAVREGTVKISPHIKTLALAAMGAQAGGAGCLWFILAIPAALWMLF